MAVLIVLALISISLSLAYAAMRGQTTAKQIQINSEHRADARQAALTAMALGLRKMHQSDWAGVGVTLSGSLGGNESYTVEYTTGDDELLASGHPDVNEYPYRVTLVATGKSTDPGSGASASHRVRAVVKLVPRALSATPSDFAAIRNYTVFQRTADDFEVHMPFRIEGQVRVQDRLEINEGYSNFDDVGSRMFTDLRDMYNNEGIDHRPFTGPLVWKITGQRSDVRDWLTSKLSLAQTDANAANLSTWQAPNASYQLYPGGQSYSLTTVSGDIPANTTLAGDPITNPLGLFYFNGSIQLWQNVSITGTLISDGANTVSIRGNNVRLAPQALPNIEGASTPLRLPTVVTSNFRQVANGVTNITGLVYADQDFTINAGPQTLPFKLDGKLVARQIYIRERDEWEAVNWGEIGGLLGGILGPLLDLLDLLEDQSVQTQPHIVIRPDPTPATLHWLRRSQPLYAVAAGDSGLRWDIVSWKDNP